MKKAYYQHNEERNGIEIYFPERPSEEILNKLRSNGFHWHRKKFCWYAKETPERVAILEQITGEASAEQKTTNTVLTPENIAEITVKYGFRRTGEGIYSGWTGNNYPGIIDDKQLKKLIIDELKKYDVKATIRLNRGGYLTSMAISVAIPENFRLSEYQFVKDCFENEPFNGWYIDSNGKQWCPEEFDGMPYDEVHKIREEHYRRVYSEDNIRPARDFRDFIETVIDSFNSDHSNSQIDYFDRYFYYTINWK